MFQLVAADPTKSVAFSPILKPVAEVLHTGILRRLLVRRLPRVDAELRGRFEHTHAHPRARCGRNLRRRNFSHMSPYKQFPSF